MRYPLDKITPLGDIPPQGRFGGHRRYDRHTGVDLYCKEGTPVYAMESGTVVGVVLFTGLGAGSPWWNETHAVLVEGDSGVILYGEVIPEVGENSYVYEGQVVGKVTRVLQNDKGLPTTMLHLEHYIHGYRGEGEWWLDGRPHELLNVEELLSKATL